MWIGCQDQGGGMRRIAALFGHSDNAEPGIRDQASRPSLSPTGSWQPALTKKMGFSAPSTSVSLSFAQKFVTGLQPGSNEEPGQA